ncbi:MAG: T9SS type A sorting domain-containing protein, partial [Bacteroidales bacterium]|nr:T9SS type A sorting domain-containing protein [Bacteroidales bacterium]
ISEYGYFKSISSNQIPELFLEVISISGQVLNTYTINAPDYQFSINNLSSGVYIYNIRKDEASGVIFRGKLIVR